MSRLVNLSDPVYEELTRMKRAKNASYSEVLEELLAEKEAKKSFTWKQIIANQIERDKHFKGKKERIDYDLVAYGVSLDRS